MIDKLKMKLEGEFTAHELEEIIGDLAKARAGLAPPVPDSPEGDMGANVLEQTNPLFTARTLTSGGVRIWIRNEGIGWLAFTLDQAMRIKLRDFLSQKIGDTHTLH